MVYALNNGRPEKVGDEKVRTGAQYWGVFSFEEAEKACGIFSLGKGFLNSYLENRSMRMESHDGFDIIHYSPMQYGKKAFPVKQVCVYTDKKVCILLSDNAKAVCGIADELSAEVGKPVSFDRLLYTLLERSTQNDSEHLEGVEQEISRVEDQLISSGNKNCVQQIIGLRKKLMLFKRHYEQTLNILDNIQENENGLIDSKSMRLFKIYANRVDRLYHIVLNLRDYVTQVREAYQAEVDINLNSVMKLFTVITAIFLPLTLIVGWYGMNLQMPEFAWPFGYPMVIILSAAVAVFCLYYFKKHKWY